jgi:hypothetical protein
MLKHSVTCEENSAQKTSHGKDRDKTIVSKTFHDKALSFALE